MVDTPVIDISGLCFRIGTFAIEDLSLEVRQGEYFVLMGPNGSGKTLLIKLIAGLYGPENGTISLNGQAVNGVPPWRRNIGYVPQEGVLFPNRSVRRNIGFGLEMRGRDKKVIAGRIQELAELTGVAHLLDRMPHGLSGGEQQKVSIARALAIEPAVLLMDEPVSALDEEARNALCTEFKKLQQQLGITTIHVSHNSRETELVADRVGRMQEGVLAVDA